MSPALIAVGVLVIVLATVVIRRLVRIGARLAVTMRTAAAAARTQQEALRLAALRTAKVAASIDARVPATLKRASAPPARTPPPQAAPGPAEVGTDQGVAGRRFGRDAVIAAVVLGAPLSLREPGTIAPPIAF